MSSLSRRCVAEFIGTFAIVFFGCGSIITLHGQVGAHLMVNTVFGLTVGAAIYALGHISAAHFNPAVTIGFAIANRFSWKEVGPYIFAQTLGGLAASGIHFVLFVDKSVSASFGATVPQANPSTCLILEAILTFFLMLVIISVATDVRVHRGTPGLAIGMTVALCGLFGGPISGCSMNPARSLAPAIFQGGTALSSYWIYLVGPIVGACFAARLYEWLRKPIMDSVPLS